MKIYESSGHQHIFDKDGIYLGFKLKKEKDPSIEGVGAPFDDWKEWCEDKHSFLISLGFKLK